MTFSDSKIVSPPSLKLNNITFKQSSKINYLGVILEKYNENSKPYTGKLIQKLFPIVTHS